MSNDKLAEALRKELGELLDREWQKILRPVLLKRAGLYLDEVRAHAAETAQIARNDVIESDYERENNPNFAGPQPQAAEPVYQYQATPDSWVDCDYDLYNASGDPKRILYTHPQPAQDAKLPSDEDFRLHLGELTSAELRVAQAAFRYAMAKKSGR